MLKIGKFDKQDRNRKNLASDVFERRNYKIYNDMGYLSISVSLLILPVSQPNARNAELDQGG